MVEVECKNSAAGVQVFDVIMVCGQIGSMEWLTTSFHVHSEL